MKRKTRSKPETVQFGNVTVKIYKRQRLTASGKLRAVFEVSDYTTGTRRLLSFTEHAAARQKAESIAKQLSTGEVTAATMRNRDAASYGRAIELLRPTGVSLEVAAATYAKAFQILGGDSLIEAAKFYKRHGVGQVIRKRVGDVVAELIAAKEARGKSARYLGDLRSRLTRFAETFAMDISSVTTSDVQHWLDRLKLQPQTCKNFRTVLHTLFQFAEARSYIFKGSNPVAETESISANGGSIEIYTPKEIADLLVNASKEFLPIVALGAFAGLRSAEISRLEWKDIDFAGGFITVAAAKAKTKARRLVPITPNLAAWLAPYAKQSGKIWKQTPNDLQDARAATVKAAKVAWKPNALRHSFISYRLADIQNAAQVALEAGNSPNVVFKHYRELVKPAAAKSFFAVSPEQPVNVTSFAAATANA